MTFVLSAPALAWGDRGHRAIVDIAWTQLSAATRAQVADLIEAAPALATPACPVGSLEDGAVWADCVRSRYKERFFKTASWHYVNVSVCGHFAMPSDPDATFIVSRLQRELGVLADRRQPRVTRLEALVWVAHLTGDLHQPLHVGDAGDRGGNEVETTVQGGRYPVNLHSLWDRNLVDDVLDNEPGGVISLAAKADGPSMRHTGRAGSAAAWARESWYLARTVAYAGSLRGERCHGVGSPAVIDRRYENGSLPVVRMQLERAGVRLAAELNTALGGR